MSYTEKEQEKTVAYDDSYYLRRQEKSLTSAAKIVEHLSKYHSPKTVIDIGCGRGSWLKAFDDSEVTKKVGVDGPWNTQTDMLDSQIQFFQSDLANPESIQIEGRFELAISLEVAEHLPPDSSEPLVKALVKYSDVVLFSAAYEHQPGRGHVNTRQHSYWAELFAQEDYVVFDLFRPVFWGDSEVQYFYQQNCFLYVRKNSDIIKNFAERNIFPMANIEFMNCVHPKLFTRVIEPPYLRQRWKKLKAKTARFFRMGN